MKRDALFIENPLLGLWSRAGVPDIMPLPHRHNELELNFIERGAITYLFPGRRIDVQEGELFFFWSGVPHQLTGAAENTLVHWLTLPLAQVLRWRLPEAFTRLIMQGIPVTGDDASYRPGDLAAFQRWHSDLLSGNEERQTTLLLEVQARLRRLAESQVHEPKLEGESIHEQSGKAERMARYLFGHFLEDWCVGDVASSAGLHPNYAMTIFRRVYGVSMVEYATQLKVARAQQLLATSEMEILDIAYECGFGSASRFYAAFRSVAQTTPRRFRTMLHWSGKFV